MSTETRWSGTMYRSSCQFPSRRLTMGELSAMLGVYHGLATMEDHSSQNECLKFSKALPFQYSACLVSHSQSGQPINDAQLGALLAEQGPGDPLRSGVTVTVEGDFTRS